MVNLDIAECNSFHENRTRIHHTQVDFYKFSEEFLYNEENVLSKRKQKVARNQDSTNIIALRASMRLYQRFELIVESSRLGLKVRELSLISIWRLEVFIILRRSYIENLGIYDLIVIVREIVMGTWAIVT